MSQVHARDKPVGEAGRAAARPRLAHVDGLRGLAALYVTLYHAAGDAPPPALRVIAWPLQFGHYAVGLFIVLSGYCLMLPVARSRNGRIEGGIAGYAARRARRILPAYYSVLLVAMAAVAVARLRYAPATAEEADVLRLTPGTVVSHLLLLHNLSPRWATAFDPPMWSIAAEWQIYALFPMLLLPAWRRFGAPGAALAGVALGVAPHLLVPARANFDFTFPWYAGLFALGMAAASIAHSARLADIRLRERVPWRAVTLAIGLVFLAVATRDPDPPVGRYLAPDLLLGGFAASLLVVLAAETDAPRRNRGPSGMLSALLHSRPALSLGVCSYCLYVVHAPVLWALGVALDAVHCSQTAAFFIRIGLGSELAVAAAFAVSLAVERPFLAQRRPR
ncbi:MAG TPA: acyltransferase [Chthonomonadaceae bacterium]|nr:acyltransferase [Chthonomonadaceae bacterium]